MSEPTAGALWALLNPEFPCESCGHRRYKHAWSRCIWSCQCSEFQGDQFAEFRGSKPLRIVIGRMTYSTYITRNMELEQAVDAALRDEAPCVDVLDSDDGQIVWLTIEQEPPS